ncbi:hypothetical protein SAMN05216276_102039 [Streptosporangium subroseum]|uniref:Uncharacterized protein n=2 Tax=Streptosporangium subroseum TaxID=106412 RepID=A0A239IND2_9ACTN|nr:hypothetical protein SAMN05216276_102039 [Streptosporangium subroseum]
MDGEYSGIDPALMDDFERGLGRAEDALGRNEPQIRSTLQRLDLDTSGLSSLREVQSWIGTSRPDLRRRSETIRTERTEWGSASGLPGELSAFDEALYGKAAHDPDVYAAIVKVTEAAENGEVDAKALAELEKRTGDATFAAALMNAMGAARFRKLMGKTVGHEDDKKVERLQIALGKTLGTASPKLSNAWRDELTSDLAIGWQEGYAISLALKYATSKYAGPEYGASSGAVNTAFLLAVAKKVDAWDREASKFPVGTDPGVTVALMEALSLDPAAAQDFFAGDPTALKHYLTERGMLDGGEALGKALEAAMLTFRDHDGSPQAPSRGYLSAKLASEFVHLEAERIEAGNSSAFVKPVTTGRILAGYISDINYVAQNAGDLIAPGVRSADNLSAPGQSPWGAQFKLEELRRVMKEAFADSKAFAPVAAAQKVFAGWLLDYGAAEMVDGRGDIALLTNAQNIGAGFGMITDAVGLAKIEEGKELDGAQQRNMKVLTAMVNTALAIPQVAAAWPFTVGAVGAWTSLVEDTAKGDAEAKAIDGANTAVDQTRILVRDLTAQAMLKSGAFGSVEPAAPTHPWASLEGLEKGDDPRDNPNNFLKSDGRTLMTTEEMIDKTAPNGVEDQRLEAYVRWLRGASGRPWQDVEGPLSQGFSDGFSQYG